MNNNDDDDDDDDDDNANDDNDDGDDNDDAVKQELANLVYINYSFKSLCSAQGFSHAHMQLVTLRS